MNDEVAVLQGDNELHSADECARKCNGEMSTKAMEEMVLSILKIHCVVPYVLICVCDFLRVGMVILFCY